MNKSINILDGFEAKLRLRKAILNSSIYLLIYFAMKSPLNSIFYNSSTVRLLRLKDIEINRNNGKPTALGKPQKTVGGDIEDTDRLTL